MVKDDLVAAVMGVLQVGKENAISCADLVIKSNLSAGRLPKALFFANQEFGIIKNKQGYYLPRDVEEAKDFYFKKCNEDGSNFKKLKGIRLYIIEQEKIA